MNKDRFIEELSKLGINVTEKQLEQLNEYKNILQEYNKHTNLTSIIEDEDIYLKHFYDSLCIVKVYDFNNNIRLLDIGSGAGFPGMVLKIMFPNISVTLIDSNNKKTKFLELLQSKLHLEVEVINDRVENYAKEHLNYYDVVTSRAVANLRVLSELSLPLVKKGGYFIPLKGKIEEELKESMDTLSFFSAKIKAKKKFELIDKAGERNILVIEKMVETPFTMLRSYDKIVKKPLKKITK